MKLYYFPGACSLATHIVLEWLGTAHETVRMTLPGCKAADYLAINPNGTVPLLQDGDFLLTENAAILGYLADLHPAAQLLGDGTPRSRAEVMRWVAFLNSDVHKAFKPIFTPGRFLPDPALAGELGAVAATHVREYLERLDTRLQGRDWLTGTRSVADPYLFVMLRWAVGKKIPMTGLTNLARFRERMYADAGVQAAIQAEEGVAA